MGSAREDRTRGPGRETGLAAGSSWPSAGGSLAEPRPRPARPRPDRRDARFPDGSLASTPNGAGTGRAGASDQSSWEAPTGP
eukprot:4163069-Alexandrium_andersonii.AAC.1